MSRLRTQKKKLLAKKSESLTPYQRKYIITLMKMKMLEPYDKNILENANKENDFTSREEELIIEASKGPFEEISFEDLCKL